MGGTARMWGSLAGVFILVAVISVVGIAFEAVGIALEYRVQRGIDAHEATVNGRYESATLVSSSRRNLFRNDVHVITYQWAGRTMRAEWRSAPAGFKVGEDLCVEVNRERPEHARLCDTRGGLADAKRGLGTGSAFLVGAIALAGLCGWASVRSPAPPPRTPVKTVSATQELILRPASVTRWAMAFGFSGVPAVLAGAFFETDAGPVPTSLMVLLAAFIAWRLLTIRVVCSAATVSVHAILPGQRIPVSSVLEVIEADTPAIRWRTPSGEQRTTKLHGFWRGRQALDSVHRHHTAQLRALKDWIAANRRLSHNR